MTFILERLAIGDIDDLKNPGPGITFTLNVAEEIDLNEPKQKYHKIALKDGLPVPAKRMIEVTRWIHRHIRSGKVLVACHYGIGRSASVLIGYLCSFGFGYQEALDFVLSKKPKINPLPQLENTIMEIMK